jgi:UDP-sugar diphosphatase
MLVFCYYYSDFVGDVAHFSRVLLVSSNGVGIAGSRQTLFYAPVTDAMKISNGGGNPDEGELIEIVEVPVSRSLDLISDTSRERSSGFLFALLWFQVFKKK